MAASLTPEQRECGTDDRQRAEYINGKLAFDLFGARSFYRADQAIAGVIDHHVETAMKRMSLQHDGGDGRCVRRLKRQHGDAGIQIAGRRPSRVVPTTSPPAAAMALASAKPSPRETPVMNQTF